ncbi:MAG: hypothetical protein WAU36_17400 [Cyclobacteriaceae bacterium]
MKHAFLIISILFYHNLFGQRELGRGYAFIKFDENTKLNFYDSQSSTIPTKTIQFFEDETINSISIRNLKNVEKWLKPRAIWLDYNIFELRALTVTDKWIEVVVNEPEWEIMWIKRDDKVDYKTWEQYLLGLFNIERKDTTKQLLYSNPSSSITIYYNGADCFKALKVDGDWIEITTPEYCESFTYWKMKIETAWIRWKDKDELLINCFDVP